MTLIQIILLNNVLSIFVLLHDLHTHEKVIKITNVDFITYV